MMTHSQYSQIKSYLFSKQAIQASQYEKMRLSELNNTVAILQQFFKNEAGKVFIFGSINHKGCFFPSSDIDIAVSGFQGNRIDLYCALSNLFQRKIDLVILEKSRIKEYILNDCIQII